MFPDVYKQFFRCYPVTQLNASEEKRQVANYGGKIYLPPSALNKLTTMRISYPMLFEIHANDSKRVSHAGVLEFVAPEGRVYLPEWMMTTLQLRQGSLVEVRSCSLELGSFVKIEPQSVAFLDISDPKAVLENALRSFSTLTVDDVFQISYNRQVYDIKVLEVRPETDRHGISVVETDLEVDFAPPVGYVDPGSKKARVGSAAGGSGESIGGAFERGTGASLSNSETARAYQTLVKVQQNGSGLRLSGKAVDVDMSPVDRSIYTNRNAPALELPEGQLFFGFPLVPVDEPAEGESASPFAGGGNTLREKRKRN